MDLKSVLVKIVVFCFPLLLSVTSCKKKKAFKEENGQSAEDVRGFQSQNDVAAKEINTAMMEQSLLRGGVPSLQAIKTQICGAEVDTLSIFSGILKLHYNGTICSGIKKTGDIIVTVVNYPTIKWKNLGCMLKVDFIAYKIISADGKLIQFDGTEYFTNVSGNTWYEMQNGLSAGDLVQTQMASDLKVSFDGGNLAIFNCNRRLTYNYSTPTTTCKIEGLGSANNKTNLDNWGQDRNGDNFTTEITSALSWKSNCGTTAAVDGEQILKVEGKDFNLKCNFAVDASGNSVAGDSGCPYGWKVSWSYKRKTNTRVIAY